MPRLLSRWLLIASLVPTCVLATGCGSGGPELYPVTGKVLVDGKPAENATVVFHPVNPPAGDVPKPRGKVGPDGTFTLTTFAAGDGAPAGEYKVTVELWLTIPRKGSPEPVPTNQLPAKYADPATSGLTAQVGAGPTELKPITVSR